ncbi:MAG: lysophospholipid acyltransferase family protein [Gammaproteobacteria bacterium]
MRHLACLIFITLCGLMVIPWTIALTLAWPFPHRVRFALVPSFARTMMWLLKHLCGVEMKVEGKESLPDGPCVVLIKHSSPWETIAELMVFPRQVIVLKRELMWVPILGWALASMRSISINRKAGRSAARQVMEQGKEHLAEGTWVMIFPEGTRVPKGRIGRWGHSGTRLAVEANVPVIPVAHNAADHWPNGRLLKIPGTITMRIGPAIPTTDRAVEEVATEARQWMDNAMLELSPTHTATLPDGTPVSSESV